MQVFNEINARKVKHEYNVFGGLLSSRTFIYILALEIAFQVSNYCICHLSRHWVACTTLQCLQASAWLMACILAMYLANELQ
jgi:hypothetical protein